jgi:hypothetical protein
MIICLVENCASWDRQGEMYLIDTSLLLSEPFRSFLESAPSSLSVDDEGEFGEHTDERQCWRWQYELDLNRAIVKPPQLVEKLISVTFD